MNWPLIVSLALSVIGWTLAIYWNRRHKAAVRSACNYLSQLQAVQHSISIERMVTQQVLANLKASIHQDDTNGGLDWWKHSRN